MLGTFDDISVGSTVSMGIQRVDAAQIALFSAAFAPTWDPNEGAPDSMVYALWARMEEDMIAKWPTFQKRLGQDALRWFRTPPAGEILRGRMTVLAKEPVGEKKGIIIAQHDVLDEDGRLVFSLLTRMTVARSEGASATDTAI